MSLFFRFFVLVCLDFAQRTRAKSVLDMIQFHALAVDVVCAMTMWMPEAERQRQTRQGSKSCQQQALAGAHVPSLSQAMLANKVHVHQGNASIGMQMWTS